MNEPLDSDLQRFETELRKVQPAPAPEELVKRLLAHRSAKAPIALPIQPERSPYAWVRWLSWLIPAAAVGLVLFTTLRHPATTPVAPPGPVESVPADLVKDVPSADQADAALPRGDELEIGRTWIATFDAVAELPTGEPVRFRCREWADTTVFRDKARGIAVEQSTPRLEIIPISFETY